MADEENPFGGGGPFGVGPFGPLVAAAVVAVTGINAGVSVTTSVPRVKTLYYQAKIAPPPQPPVEVATAESFSVTTGRASSKSLFYQARIGPPPVAAAVDNTGTFATWYVQLSRAAARPPVDPTRYTPFVPSVAPQPTADQWLQPFRRQVAGPFPVHTQPTFPYTPAAVVVVADVTPDQWLPRWRGPPSYVAAPAGGSPFVPKEAVLENTQTPDKWLPRWQGPPSYHPAPAGGSPFVAKEAVRENTQTPDKWMQPFYQAVPHAWPTKQVLPFVPKEATLENTVTPDKWLQAWKGPPNYNPAPQGGSPFIPREAVLENTVTPDKWLVRFQGAVPVPPVHHTQPVLGYPYAAASNLTTTLEWMPAWRGPPSYTPIKVQVPPFVPKADIVDQVTPDKWLQAWRGPPRAVPAQAGGSPFVPKEAVLENTVTPDKWLVRFAKAVPTPKPVPTQPEFRYPYETQAIVVPYEQWWHQPLSRAPARPAVHTKPYQPFVPKEAVLENTQTPDKWLQRWQAPPAYRPIKVQTPPFVPKAAIVDVVSPDKWHRDLGRAAPRPQARPTQPPFVYSPPAVVTLTTTLEWQQPLSVAVKARPVRHTQPSLYLPAVVVVAEAAEAEHFSVTWAHPRRKTLFYQAKIVPAYVPPFVENTETPDKWLRPLSIAVKRPPVWPTRLSFGYPYLTEVEGGPADEPERVICIREDSRVAVVPEVLRTATVLVSSRVATVPELSRTVEALLSDREENSNEFRTLPCTTPIPEPEQDAFQVDDAFQDSGFQ